ncbi:hypothetical protein IWW36_002863 [Coemansia brasiliensis]|uniref:Uncharacterized protein n=1 Tax=Coemansia brasiliensis TaxID=2650707 RepID=A0A9W8IDY0_9FUNG|nr:hypothetical protein IWW36_002863 [Coemansia brasiliensis]
MVHLTTTILVDENVSETATMVLTDVQINSCLSHDVVNGVLARVEEVVMRRFNELTDEAEIVEQTHNSSVVMRDSAQQMVQFTIEEKEMNEELLQEANGDEDEARHLQEQIERNNQAVALHNQTVESANEDINNYAARLDQIRGAMNLLEGRGPASYKVTVHDGIVRVVFEGSARINEFDDLVIKDVGEEEVDPAVSVDLYELIQGTVEGYVPGAAPAA